MAEDSVIMATTMSNTTAANIASSNNNDIVNTQQETLPQQPPPPIVYGELSILGYNGFIPNLERNGRRNRSKFLLCKRPIPNGIKKSRDYIVKQQPQSTKAIQDKSLHSISFTFSRSQTIIVEYKQDENTDMFQIGRSSEDPIDFVVMDTISAAFTNNTPLDLSSNQNNHNHHHHYHHHHHNSRKHHQPITITTAPGAPSSSQHDQQQQQQQYSHLHNENRNRDSLQNNNNILSGGDILSGIGRLHRHLTKVGEEQIYRNQVTTQLLARSLQLSRQDAQAFLLANSNLPPNIAEQIIRQQQQLPPQQPEPLYQLQHFDPNHPIFHGQSSSSQQQALPQQNQQQPHIRETSVRRNNNIDNIFEQLNNQNISSSSSNRHNITSSNNISSSSNGKRSHSTQSTISRFACRIIIDRHPPFTARIYAAGFDSSKNIFLGEKATKWEHNNTIDGLTTNGVLLMHPKRTENMHGNSSMNESKPDDLIDDSNPCDNGRQLHNNNNYNNPDLSCTKYQDKDHMDDESDGDFEKVDFDDFNEHSSKFKNDQGLNLGKSKDTPNDSGKSNPSFTKNQKKYRPTGGVWREVSVDGGIYAIRESRSAAQKGVRIDDETNVLQDGTLIDLCGATLLWRSVDGFKASPTKKSLEEKVDMLNATRPQCPVGLNTLVIPRKPILRSIHQYNQRHHHHHHHFHRVSKDELKIDSDKNSHQPYVYLKCGHVQGYHDWGATDKLNQRTCPICLEVGTVAQLSMGLEPSFYVDSGPLTHAFNPCGHIASEKTVKYWSSIKIPHGTHFFHSICPFCATPLDNNESPLTRLIFQDDLD